MTKKRMNGISPWSGKGLQRRLAYSKLREELMTKDNGLCALCGKPATGGEHHIDGRDGYRLLDPFNIIPLCLEHHTNHTRFSKEYLADLIRPIRKEQGY